jgi:hypothetical protein
LNKGELSPVIRSLTGIRRGGLNAERLRLTHI